MKKSKINLTFFMLASFLLLPITVHSSHHSTDICNHDQIFGSSTNPLSYSEFLMLQKIYKSIDYATNSAMVDLKQGQLLKKKASRLTSAQLQQMQSTISIPDPLGDYQILKESTGKNLKIKLRKETLNEIKNSSKINKAVEEALNAR